MCKNIAIIGGDMRMIYLADILAKEKKVVTYGQELYESKEKTNTNNMQQDENLKLLTNQADYIIAPIPFSKDGENVYAEFSKKNISINELITACKGKTLIAGAISKTINKLANDNNVKIIDIMKDESLTILNAIATAEGAIDIAIRKSQKNIHGSKVLILGYGRVGKMVAKKFAGLSANITCAARREEVFSWIEADGFKYININELGDNLADFDIIINTPPVLILNRDRLKKIKKDSLIIDLASKPGGVDIKSARELNINFEWALALPGKVSPKTSAEYIGKALENIFRRIKQ